MNHRKSVLAVGVIALCLSACEGGIAVDGYATEPRAPLAPVVVSAAELGVEYATALDDVVADQEDDVPLNFAAALPGDPTRKRQINIKSAVRFLNQATFGATKDSLADFRRGGWRTHWLKREFQKPSGKSYTERLAEYYAADRVGEAFPKNMFGVNMGREFTVNLTWQTWIEATDQLRKRITAALLEIFVINARVGTIGLPVNQWGAAAYMDLLDKNAFGNFRDLLYDISLSPAMGVFLSHIDNQKAKYNSSGKAIRLPDENYAREILQLFSIGLYELNADGTLKKRNGKPIETYDQDDIFNLARVFTGFSSDTEDNQIRIGGMVKPMIAIGARHSQEEKTFLGHTIPVNTSPMESLNQAVDVIFNHPNVGPFIGKQLIQRLVTSNPSKAYIKRVTKAFNDNGSGVRGDMKSVINAVLLDPEGMSRVGKGENSSVRGKLKEPMIRLMHIAKLLSTDYEKTLYPIGSLQSVQFGLGQSPLKSSSVFNFFRPGYTPPRSKLAEGNYVGPEFQIVTGSAISGSINFINDFIMRSDDLFTQDTRYLEQLSSNPQALVDHLDLLLTHHRMSKRTRNEIRAAIESIPAAQKLNRVKAGLMLVSSSPAFLIDR